MNKLKISNKQENRITLVLISILVILILVGFNSSNIGNKVYVKYFEVYVCILLIANLVFSFNEKRELFSIYNIFHYTFALYYLGKLILDLIGYEVFGHTVYYREGILENKYLVFILISLSLSLISLNIGRRLFNYRFKNKIDNIKFENLVNENSKNKYFCICGLIMFTIGLIPTIYILINDFKFILDNSYLGIYSGAGIQKVNIFIRLLANFFNIGFILFLSTKPKIKLLIGPVGIYLIYIFASALTGGRKILFGRIIMLIIYVFLIYKLKFNKKVLVISLLTILGLIIIGQSTVAFRNKYTMKTSITDKIHSFISDQSTSVYVIGYTKEHEEGFSKPRSKFIVQPIRRYILENAISRYLFKQEFNSKQDKEGVKQVQSLSYELSYMMNPKLFEQGHGLGSSYIAELYLSFGYIGIILGNIIIGFLFMLIQNKAMKSRLVLFVFCWSIPNILLMVRENPLEFLVSLDKPILVYVILLIIYNFINRYLKDRNIKFISKIM